MLRADMHLPPCKNARGCMSGSAYVCLVCYDFNQLPNNTFTYMGYGHSNCRWLDHIVGKNCISTEITYIEVFCDMIGSDHFPLKASLSYLRGFNSRPYLLLLLLLLLLISILICP